MTDTVTKERRSEIMSFVPQKDTRPEKKVRSFLFRKGLRYRLHVKELPGRPDVVFPGLNAAVFINGCFWHGHKDGECKLARIPKSNVTFWETKIKGNRERDIRNWKELKSRGWRVFVIWECNLTKKGLLEKLVIDLRKTQPLKEQTSAISD
ncbi:MAG: very short patch repair endonuclease [Nitrospinota bacterium]|nr:DNA mismatch endonuclease Vsr [Nitrospira sp.]MDH5457070.1 very short patch repair endonuclease [Nitrospinota bacterium]